MNFHEQFVINVLNYFLPTTKQTNKKINTNIIRKHSEKLSKSGDYSFPVNTNSWKYLLTPKTNTATITEESVTTTAPETLIDEAAQTIFETTKQESNKIIIQSNTDWKIPIERIDIKSERCLLFLNRSNTFNHVILDILNNIDEYGKINEELIEKKEITLIHDIVTNESEEKTNWNKKNLTEYRSILLTNILRNILRDYCGYKKIYNDLHTNKNCTTILITHRSTLKSNDNNYSDILNLKTILCGGVRYQSDDNNPGNNSTTVSAEEYIKKRSVDIELMAQHKYGVRVKNENIFINLIRKLGVAAVTVDLLEVKHSSSVKLPFRNHSGGVSRGAAFILYNSARIETIFSTFSQKVAENYYPPLPTDLNLIDLTLLGEEEEWELLFNYIMEFPNVISRTIGDIDKSGGQQLVVAPHLICHFLSGLVGCFSVYYRRCRILTENREQLLPTLFARLILLKCVRIVLNKSLAILNIEPVQQM